MSQQDTTFGVGGAVFPLVSPGTHTLLQDADPALFFWLDFWSYAIRTFAGARFLAAAAAAGLKASGAAITDAVAQRYPWQPLPEQLSTQFKFPLLAAYRKQSEYRKKTIGWDDDECAFDLIYVLPPMTAAQTEQVQPILRAIEAVLRHKTSIGLDAGYTPPGGAAGDNVTKAAGLEAIQLDRGHHGALQGTGNLWFPSLRIEGKFIERDMYVSMGQKFTGADITVDLLATDGTRVPTLVAASTQAAPAITSLSAGAGPSSGGTSVVITGARFLPGPPAVLFGNRPAASVTFTDSGHLTAVTPAMSGAGTVGVTVVNPDGQVATLPASFAFT